MFFPQTAPFIWKVIILTVRISSLREKNEVREVPIEDGEVPGIDVVERVYSVASSPIPKGISRITTEEVGSPYGNFGLPPPTEYLPLREILGINVLVDPSIGKGDTYTKGAKATREFHWAQEVGQVDSPQHSAA